MTGCSRSPLRGPMELLLVDARLLPRTPLGPLASLAVQIRILRICPNRQIADGANPGTRGFAILPPPLEWNGGGSRIRTHGPRKGTTVFKSSRGRGPKPFLHVPLRVSA